MADARTAILRGKRAAARLHRAFGMRERVEADGGRIDVFDTIVRSGVPLLFKPLDGLLGVFINDPMPGVMVTTKRGLNIQRFTGAHELGHCTLGHHPSLDDESMLRRSPFGAGPDYEQQEREADAFATEFMLPPWLFARKPTLQLRLDRIDELQAMTGITRRIARNVLSWAADRARLKLDWFAGRGWRGGEGFTVSGLNGTGKASDHAPIVARFE